MKTIIVGANGGIGRILSRQLSEEKDHEPVAMIREESQKEYFDGIGVNTAMGDLLSSVSKLADTFTGMDAVVFTAGSGGSTGYDKTFEIDLDGAVKCVEAAEQAGVSRFIMVSALSAGDREAWNDSPIRPYMIAKHYADRILTESSIDHTILRPGSLTDADGKGTVITDTEQADGRSIPREDVASVISECLISDEGRNTVIDLLSGNTKISDAVASA